MKKYCITFAGTVGSSKTPIAHYLSMKFGLPIHGNDVLRTEVTEDVGVLDEPEYEKRRDERLREMIETGRSFILDASVDRQWNTLKEKADQAGYSVFVISLDLSKSFLTKLFEAKGYDRSLKLLDQLLADHAAFLKAFGPAVGLHLADAQFPERLRLSYEAVKAWIEA